MIIDKKGKLIKNNWDSITDEMQFLNQTNTFIKRIYLNRQDRMENELSEIEEIVKNKFIEHGLINVED
ncbi:hypothetical protein [Chryseobacterium sp.]|uniref:hypothetical protein n=1 Tax=Chryseobacterium sp. TaxID=1871047 RepID=UPI001AFD9052|nr:hypothetical protein [Chryseobacterium sp.]MBO9691104.1 hypothetical protein [Chryseobacterium sp.]